MADGQFTLVQAADINLQLADMPEGTEFENLGTTVEVVAQPGVGTMNVGGTEFALQQFHFHLPSEHLDNGTSRAMEMHMVFESAAGNIGVVSMFIDVDQGAGAVAAEPAAVEATAAETAGAEATAPAGTEAAAAGEATAAAGEEEEEEEEEEAATAAVAEKRWAGRIKKRVPERKETRHQMQPRATAGESTSSTLLETVFASVGQVSQPGSVTKTAPLVMSELLTTLNAGQFQS